MRYGICEIYIIFFIVSRVTLALLLMKDRMTAASELCTLRAAGRDRGLGKRSKGAAQKKDKR